MAAKRKLFLYEALELRAEYDARIKTIKDCLPETRQNRDWIASWLRVSTFAFYLL